MTIGVLALQGDFQKHHHLLQLLGLESLAIRYPEQLDRVEGLVLPGGESTTMTRLLRRNGFDQPLRDFSRDYPLLGTCAGLILMATRVSDPRVTTLNLLDITVARNAYGRQVHSFTAPITVRVPEHDTTVPGTFIRAPKIQALGSAVEVLATHRDEPVAVRQGHHMGLTFHPELDDVTLFHQLLFAPVKQPRSRTNSNPIHVA
jgi:5'-phosphate synthase pdxT subunit